MSSPELVTVTIDGREIQVPKGTGLVETATYAGVEIPVFCYEPRLGPAVGACRMCLCEVDGMPKLQAACTMQAQDELVVRTSATSAKAAEGQNAVLEFILLNHPLDCPDCDKGGECPLQDLTFRFGPGRTRMLFPKRTFDKPIPISPTIALDRERCILCYRCTRFSEGISEDGQLVAKHRGANSIIATFENEPYRAHFSGNVTELCPVGALLPTTYRFRARPWEIDNVPTVCGLCPVGCNVWVTTREGKPTRVLSRNHPEIDDGWLCDKGRFAFDHVRASDRVRAPLLRVRRRGFEPVSWEQAVDEAERGLREAGGPVVVAFSGSETNEAARALAQLVRVGLEDANAAALLPDDIDPALDAFRAPLSSLRSAEAVLVVGDDPVVERAPIVDLWLRAARRDGVDVVYATPDGDPQTGPGGAASTCASLASRAGRVPPLQELENRLHKAERVALVWSEDAPDGGRALAALAGSLPGEVAAFVLPRSPNGRGVARAWYEAGDGRGPEPPADGEIGALVISGDEAMYDPRVLELAARARFVLTTSMYMGDHTLQAHLVLPGTGYLERDGTVVNLEGRPQRQRKAVEPPGDSSELEFYSRLAERFGLAIPAWAGELPSERATLEPPTQAQPVKAPKRPARAAAGRGIRLVRYRPLFTGPAVERVEALAFQRPTPEVELAWDDADRQGIATGDSVTVSSNGTSRELRAKVNRRLKRGVARIAAEHADGLAEAVEVSKA
jgi:NADH-quinone oxidoreductase subunit G